MTCVRIVICILTTILPTTMLFFGPILVGWYVNYYILKILISIKFISVFAYLFQASDDSPQQLNRYSPAVYTHCYDESGTRLFAAGGPLAVEKKGNYAAVWS